jgi:hypothetical protein
MTLDTLDAAFVRRWQALPTGSPPPPTAPDSVSLDLVPHRAAVAPPRNACQQDAVPEEFADLADCGTSLPEQDAQAIDPGNPRRFLRSIKWTKAMEGFVHGQLDAPLVDRLLVEAASQWQEIADRVEAARGRGRRVIAVAGHERGEGRTTIVAALDRVLRSRGREVVVCDAGNSAAHAGPPHDRRIVLADAGVWFPPGPIRRSRLLVASYGCEAVILVRRADRPTAPAIEAALAAIGIESLGEVVTFATSAAEPEKDA